MTKTESKPESEPSVAIAEPFRIEGKTPWEFCCEWYKPGEIAWSIARMRAGFGGFAIEANNKIPEDVYSPEFAEWLTHQYRLAMNKGIQIGRREA